MRIVLVTALLTMLSLGACRGKQAPEPAWPKSAGHVAPETWEEDGGESLEPRIADHAAAIESSEDGSGGDVDIDAVTPAPEMPGEMPHDADFSFDETIIIDDGDPPPPEY